MKGQWLWETVKAWGTGRKGVRGVHRLWEEGRIGRCNLLGMGKATIMVDEMLNDGRLPQCG